MTKYRQKMKKGNNFLIKLIIKYMENFARQRCLDPNLVFKICMNPDPVCPERLDPDPVNIRPDPQPCS